MFCTNDVSKSWFKAACEKGEKYFGVCKATCCKQGHGTCGDCSSSLVEETTEVETAKCEDEAMFCTNDVSKSWFKAACKKGDTYFGFCKATCCQQGHGTCGDCPSSLIEETTETK